MEQNFGLQLRLLLRDRIQMKTSTQPRRIIIVGGVAGGASAAAKARRVDENAEIHVFERGPYISFANCGLPYFIAGEIDDRAKLIIMTPEKFWSRSRVHAHVNHEVLVHQPRRQNHPRARRRTARSATWLTTNSS